MKDIFNIETLGEAMRPIGPSLNSFCLSREERDHIAGHALDSMNDLALSLAEETDRECLIPEVEKASACARKIAALSNLLGDIGWEGEATRNPDESMKTATPWVLGQLFPVAQLRPWLERWQKEDDEALVDAQQVLEIANLGDHGNDNEGEYRLAIADAQTKLGTGAIFLARIEKWMASHGN